MEYIVLFVLPRTLVRLIVVDEGYREFAEKQEHPQKPQPGEKQNRRKVCIKSKLEKRTHYCNKLMNKQLRHGCCGADFLCYCILYSTVLYTWVRTKTVFAVVRPRTRLSLLGTAAPSHITLFPSFLFPVGSVRSSDPGGVGHSVGHLLPTLPTQVHHAWHLHRA